MDHDQTFRIVLIIGALLVFPIAIYYRIRSQATREPLDRWQEGRFILFTLRPVGIASMLGLVANSLTAANWFLLLTGGTAFLLMVVRTRIEEDRLVARFGDAYRLYMARTGRFLPRIVRT